MLWSGSVTRWPKLVLEAFRCRTCSYTHVFSCRPNPGTSVCLRTHTHSLSLFLARTLSLSFCPSPSLVSLSLSRTFTYGGVWWRMVAYGAVSAVWRCEARQCLSDYRLLQYISPPIHSYRFLHITYRLRQTGIASFPSDIGYTDRWDLWDSLCVSVSACLCVYI
jgi:hypothetical protein